jgi:hypothetical protein
MQYAVVFFAFSIQFMWSLSSKKNAGFWTRVCQISTWLWILVSWPRPTITLSSSPSSSSMPIISLRRLGTVGISQSPEIWRPTPEYPCYPSWHQFSKYFENWCQDENRDGDYFLCTSEGPASVSQQLAGETVVPIVLPLCTAMFLYWQQYCFH